MNFIGRTGLKTAVTKGCILLTIAVFYTVFSAQAQTDQCASIGWANYDNTTFVGPVTGGGTATPVTVTTIAALKTAANSTGAKVIYVQGTMGAGYFNAAGERVDVKSDKTIIGLPGAVVSAFFSVKNCDNVIFRNLIVQGPGAHDVDGWDDMTIDNSTRIWVDHCEFRDGEDGNLDIKNASSNVTVTWTKFSYTSVTQDLGALNHSFSDLIGSSDSDTQDDGNLKVTFQYNWWNGAVERTPRVRFGQVHVVNNLFTEMPSPFPPSKLGVTAGFNADVLVQNNAFIGINDPIDVSKMAGTSKMTATGNLFSGTSGNTVAPGGAFTPPYTLAVAANSVLNTTTFKNCVGATLSAPPTITCPCTSALPLTLISFDLKTSQNNYLLQWSLADIKMLKDISVEYSSDGIHFQSIAVLEKETTNYIIPSATIRTNTNSYIRLKMIETTGAITYSRIRTIDIQNAYTIYPNPFEDHIQVSGMKGGTATLYSVEGNQLYESSIPESGIINLSHIPIGIYFLTLIDPFNGEIKRIPLVKIY